MNRLTKGPEQIVREIISYLETRLAEPIGLSSLAEHTGYSVPWLVALFKKQTGKSILAHRSWLRMEKAKNLLQSTNLSVTEIAFEIGYNSYTRFSIAFKKTTGMSPSAFRAIAFEKGDTARIEDSQHPKRAWIERFRDSFFSPELKPCWKQNKGEWWHNDGRLMGRSEEELSIQCTLPLPENFALIFEFCFFPEAGLLASDLDLVFHSGHKSDFYVSAALGREDNTVSEFAHSGWFRNWDCRPCIIPGTWHTLQAQLYDDTCRIILDSREIFAFRDPFPPSYAKRCFFEIQSWQSLLAIRNLAVFDLGFAPLLPAARQADSLYNNGIFDQAQTAYMRLLSSTSDPAACSELQYKIGMCFLRRQMLSEARAWFSRITHSPHEGFWEQQAQLAQLEIFRLLNDLDNFKNTARQMFAHPIFRDGIRTAFERAANERKNRGFVSDALDLFTAWDALETPGTYHAVRVEGRIPNFLSLLRRNHEAIAHSQRLLGEAKMADPSRFQLQSDYASFLAGNGQLAESEKVVELIRNRTTNKYRLARCDILHAFNLRGAQKFEEAITVLETIPGRYPGIAGQAAFAQLLAAQIYCQIAQPEKALQKISHVEQAYPRRPYLDGYYEGLFRYPPHFVLGEFGRAARILLAAAAPGKSEPYTQGLQMVQAGLCFILAGEEDQAMATWKETSRRLPAAQCLFFGALAQRLAADDWSTLELLPYPGTFRSEVFYLAGRVQQRRKNADLARRYFQIALAEDPTLNWFTWLAKKELGL